MHVSNLKEGGCLENRLLTFGFGCPLCTTFKTRSEEVIRRHLGNHIANAVHFQDYVICRCNLPCRVGGHFHCPFCGNTLIRKECMTSHLTVCQNKSHVVQPMLLASYKPQLPESPPPTDYMVPPVCLEHSYFLSPPESSQTSDHSYAQAGSPMTPTVATDIDQPIPASPSDQLLIQEENLTPQEEDVTPQEENLTPQEEDVTPQEENLTPQEDVTPQEENLTPQEDVTPQEENLTPQEDVTPQEENLTPQEVDLNPQEDLTPQEEDVTPQEENLTPQEENLALPSSRIKCPHCPLTLYKKNLAVHIKRRHSKLEDVTAISHLKSVCIDQINGIYAVSRISHGFSVPVHVQRKTWGQQHLTKCELEDCQQNPLLLHRSGVSHSSCPHIRSVDYCSTTATEEPLQQHILDQMVENYFCSQSKVDVCKRRQREAEEAHVPLTVFLDLSGSKNDICFSIYEPQSFHYSPLGRVIVTHNTKKNSWHCPCAKARTSCTHKNIAKWHLFQINKRLFVTAQLTKTASQLTPNTSHSPTTDLERTVKYEFEFKKIPATLPEEATALRALTDYSKHLFPDEMTCQLCPDHPKLLEVTLVTSNARIVGMQGVIQNVSMYNKCCPKCKLVYRYQEWRDGLHNFNDHIILTLQLCVYLRNNLQNHMSVSRVINSLEILLRVDFPATDLIFQGYCHFEALSNREYKSSVSCGFPPPGVTMDPHRRGGFGFEVSDQEQPDSELHGEHNMVSFWESLHLHMISQGFFELPSQNPFAVSSAYGTWAHWLGEETHKGNTILNTEMGKVPLQSSTAEAQPDHITEDCCADELLKEKANMAEKAFGNKHVCMADPMKFCVFQTSQTTGQRLLYPDVECLQWLQCQTCSGWLHQDCAGKCSKLLRRETFNCGCTDLTDSSRIRKDVEEGGILSLLSGNMIKALHDDLTTGNVRSNRMFLWQNSTSSADLQQHLKLRTLNLSDQRIFQLLRVIEEATGVGTLIKKGEVRLLDFVFDVLLPEILIKILQNKGMTRLQAEILLAEGSIF